MNYRKVTLEELKDRATYLLAKAVTIRVAKGKDYSGDDDRLSNFHRLAERLKKAGATSKLIWAAHFMKQVDAVMSWVEHDDVASEPIEDRFADLINYCILGYALDKAAEEIPKGKLGLPLTLQCSICGERYRFRGQNAFCPHELRKESQ